MSFLDKLLDDPESKWKGRILPWGSILMKDMNGKQSDLECWSPKVIPFGTNFSVETNMIMNHDLVLRSLKDERVFFIDRDSLMFSSSEIAQVNNHGELLVCAKPTIKQIGHDAILQNEWLAQARKTGIRVGKSLIGSEVILLSIRSRTGGLVQKIFKVEGHRVYRARQLTSPEEQQTHQLWLMYDDVRPIVGS